jgi:hypothetical protein
MLRRILTLAAFAIALTANIAAFAVNGNARANLKVNNLAPSGTFNEPEVAANYRHSGANWINFRGGGTNSEASNLKFENANVRLNINLRLKNPEMRNGVANSFMKLNASNGEKPMANVNVWENSNIG